jgi:hypothetical protein
MGADPGVEPSQMSPQSAESPCAQSSRALMEAGSFAGFRPIYLIEEGWAVRQTEAARVPARSSLLFSCLFRTQSLQELSGGKIVCFRTKEKRLTGVWCPPRAEESTCPWTVLRLTSSASDHGYSAFVVEVQRAGQSGDHPNL